MNKIPVVWNSILFYFMAPISHSMPIASSFFRKQIFQKTLPGGMTYVSISSSDGKNMDKFLLQDIFQNYRPCPCNYFPFS